MVVEREYMIWGVMMGGLFYNTLIFSLAKYRNLHSKYFSFRTVKALLRFFLASFVNNTDSQGSLIFVSL